jgi:uncharacterized protein Smg (DUF494 family)
MNTTFSIADTSIVDLVVIFAEGIMCGELSDGLSDTVFGKLSSKGFTRQQLEYAFSIALDRTYSVDPKKSMRIFSNEELGAFLPQASSLFIKLNQLGILDEEQSEVVLMRAALKPEDKLSESELKMIVAMMLSRDDYEIPKGFFVPENDEQIH